MECSYDWCVNSVRRNGLCDGHSQQLKKRGVLTKLNKTPVDRFFDNVIKTNYCWEWNGSFSSTGYGRIAINGKTVGAHRLSYTMFNGEIPSGMVVRHVCHNRACVNPEHLLIGTPKDNTQDSVRDGRMASGANHPKSKLTDSQVRSIRYDNRSAANIAKDYHVDKSTILKIKRGESYGRVL